MDSEIVVKIDRSFGKNRYYADNDLAKFLCDLMRIKSFTIEHLKKIKDFGWTIEVSKEEIDL